MTINGWVQIALFSVIVILITRPFGGYITRVFAGERTFFSPVLRPVERAVYWCCGVDEKEEQHWLTYAVAMLLFSIVGFLTLYALQRLQWYLPFNPQEQTGIEPSSAFNTSVSFVTNTNWQSYVPETSMSYLVQMAGLTVHNFVSAATGIALALALIRGVARREAKAIGAGNRALRLAKQPRLPADVWATAQSCRICSRLGTIPPCPSARPVCPVNHVQPQK